MNFYAQEKIKELEKQRQKALAGRPSTLSTARNKPVFGPLASVLGGTLRRVGEGLETWGNPAARQPERPYRLDHS
jgi:hypothetical protein